MFNIRLNSIRKERGFTAQKMADLLSMSERSYRFYEAGQRSPSLDTLVKVADILSVSTDYLLCRDDYLSSCEGASDEC